MKKRFNSRKNEQIRVKEVRVIFGDENLGVISTRDAISLAKENNLDLVEISANANPPVCKILDWGKYKYEKSKNDKQIKQSAKKTHEIKIGVNIAEHDYNVKVNHIKEFLKKGESVKVLITFKGRQLAHKDIGRELAIALKGELGCNTTPIKDAGKSIQFYANPDEIKNS